MGREDLAGAKRASRWSLVIGTAVAALVSGPIALGVFGNGWLGVLASAQTAYLMSSATLLTFHRDRLLMGVLAPGAGLAVAALLSDAIPDALLLGAALATVGAVVAAMAWITRTPDRQRLLTPSRYELRLAVIHAALGGTWAALIGVSALAVAGTGVLTTVSIAAAPMVLTTGVAEWKLIALLHRARRQLAGITEPADFARLSRRNLLGGFSLYLASISITAGLVGLLAHQVDPLEAVHVRLLIGFVFLGGATFAGLLLATLDRAGTALSASVIALVVTAGFIALARTGSVDPTIAYEGGCLALCCTLLALAQMRITDPVAYR